MGLNDVTREAVEKALSEFDEFGRWRLGENDANHEGDKHRRPKQIYDLPAGVWEPKA